MMQKRGSIIGGLILIGLGLFFLALQMIPGLAVGVRMDQLWPLIVVGVGGCFLLGAFLGAPGLAIPGSIVGGIGGLLYYQNLTGDWDSWAYAWALILGFVGVGIMIMHTLDGHVRQGIGAGGRLILISLTLFAVFGFFLGGWGRSDLLWPAVLIVLGLYLLAKSVVRAGK
ncbi:MAG: hypothetical protein AB1791_16815 [Chloroflexota bacterium]